MRGTWESLTQDQKDSIRARARRLSEAELEERFSEVDGKVVFRIQRATERAQAGVLDVDREAVEDAEATSAEERAALEAVLTEEIEEYELVEVTLISPEDFDYEPELSSQDEKAAKAVDAEVAGLEPYFSEDVIAGDAGESAAFEAEAEAAGLPAVVDHRPRQSSIKDQAARGTCVSHAALAVLEAQPHIMDDLSEQCAHYKFNEFLNRPHNVDAGLRTTDAAPFLARDDGRVCEERDWPYIRRQGTIDRLVEAGAYGPPAACQNGDDYGYGRGGYKIITDRGLTGESIKNTRYLEALLHQGYDVVVGTWASWDDKDNNGVLDPVLDSNGEPLGRGGHAMLIVGYNRAQRYFILKNSWNRGWGHGGYGYFSYDFVRTCFKYGFVVRDFVPAAPAAGVPRQLARAPYSSAPISRSRLRAAVLFMKTSRGRFAVTEAYAGYNLMLRNLRVYNPDGSVHLERENLVVRGTYLCDLDRGRESRTDADFWWQAVRPGVNNLVPRNGASAAIAFDFAGLTAARIDATRLTSSPVASDDLDYAVIVGKTTANRRFKMLVHAKPRNRLELSYLEVFDSRGRRYRYRSDIEVRPSWTYNLDTMRQGGGRWADIWWRVVSDGVGFLERYSRARTQLVWQL